MQTSPRRHVCLNHLFASLYTWLDPIETTKASPITATEAIVHPQTWFLARRSRFVSYVTGCTRPRGLKDFDVGPQLHRRGAHRITKNDLHDGRTGAQLRPNVQRRSASERHPFSCPPDLVSFNGNEHSSAHRRLPFIIFAWLHVNDLECLQSRNMSKL